MVIFYEMDGPKVCRVCLCTNKILYRIADKLNAEAYEKLTNSKVVGEGRPCRVCCACLSALQRCRTFMETATRANAALDQWHRGRARGAPPELTERPLFVFTTSPLEHFEISIDEQQPIEKQETDNQENYDEHILYTTEQIKFEVNEDGDDVELYRSSVICNSDDESQVLADEVLETGRSITLEAGDDENCTNVSVEAGIVADEMGGVCVSDWDTPAPGGTSTKRASSNKHTHSGPATKRRRPAPARHRPADTDPAFGCNIRSYKNIDKIIHTGVKPFACDKCDYKSIIKNNVTRHLMTHTGEKPFACDKCHYKSSRKEELKKHLLRHTGEKLYGCDNCDYKCNKKEQLKIHFMIHAGVKPFACDKCDYKCCRKGQLKAHLMTHTDERPFACDKCDYKCRRNEKLKMHLMMHTGEKPFACDRCHYKSIDKSRLKRHFLTHTGEKPFACDKCDYKCSRNGILKKHMLAHTGEK